MTMLQTLLAFLVALTLLVFVHELGHYLAARWCGVKVLRFSVGFGPSVFTWRVGPDRTEWALSAIPLGGYVKMLDEREQGTDAIPAADLPRAFSRQSLGRRAFIVVSGPLANFILAIGLYGVINLIGVDEPAAVVASPPAATAAAQSGFTGGDRLVSIDGRDVRSWNEVRLHFIDGLIERRPVAVGVARGAEQLTLSLATDGLPPGELERDFLRTLGLELGGGRVRIASISSGSAAQRAGLQGGDEVIAAGGAPITRASQLIDLIRANPGRPVGLDIEREGLAMRIEVTPDAAASDRPGEQGQTIGRIGAGIGARVAMVDVRYGPLESLQRAVVRTWDMSVFSLRMLGKMVMGELSWRNLSGPVAIADYAGQSSRVGWYAYLGFLALISISLGVLNLLPVPVLDGGHLVYYGVEAIRGRPLSERSLELTQKAGMAVIGLMMAVALFNDLSRLIGS
ncbi:MAG: RIP metalloprotease RseP [Burkholderiales bacterium]